MLRPAALLVFALAASGCFLFGGGTDPDDGGPDRCEQDRYDCQDSSAVPELPGCELEGELIVEIGQGLDAFEPLAPGDGLPTFSGGGGFQGGGVSHTSLGLRIAGAALDRYDVLGARLGVFEPEACTPMSDGTRICEGVAWIGNREVLLGAGPALNVVGGVVEEFGLTMIIEDAGSSGLVVQAIVQDPCGRVGIAHHDLP